MNTSNVRLWFHHCQCLQFTIDPIKSADQIFFYCRTRTDLRVADNIFFVQPGRHGVAYFYFQEPIVEYHKDVHECAFRITFQYEIIHNNANESSSH